MPQNLMWMSHGSRNCLVSSLCRIIRLFASANHERPWYNTLGCCHNAVQYYKISHEKLQELRQNINQMPDPQKTPHTSPLRASYGVSYANICEKIDRVITVPDCITFAESLLFELLYSEENIRK